MQKFKDETSTNLYGMTKSKANDQKICIDCKKPITDVNVRDATEIREYHISGLCGLCWDKIFS